MQGTLTVALLLATFAVCLCDLRIQSLDRQINLQSQFVKVTQSVKLKNTGDSALKAFEICALARLAAHEAFFKVTEGKKKQLQVENGRSFPAAGVECRTVRFAAPLEAGQSLGLTAYSVYTKAQVPKPFEIKQDEAQFLVYIDNLYALSPYQVSQQNTEVLLPSSQVLSYTKHKTASLSGSTLKYGRFDGVKPFSIEELSMHYESSKPIVEVLKLEKEVQISHWGNIYVEESYELKNAGAQHVGAFSRLKYSQQFQRPGNSFRELVAKLPPNAHSLYYKDLIGNISTSTVRKLPSATLLNFELRYPLMGGWKVDFLLGWSLPLDKALFQLGWGKLQLRTTFGASVDGVHVDELVLKVVLPEGSTYTSDSIPFDVQRNFTTKFTYLDTTGRPVLVLEKRNVVPEHNVPFEVEYAFNRISLLREPILLIGGFAAFFALVVLINRLDLTISKDDNWKEQQKQEQLNTVMLSLSNLFTDVEVEAEKLSKLATSTRDSSGLEHAASEKAFLEGRLKSLQAQIDAQVSALRGISVRLAGQLEEEVARKALVLKEKCVAQLTLKLDLIKKGASAVEINKKMGDYTTQIQQLEREFHSAIDRLFGQY